MFAENNFKLNFNNNKNTQPLTKNIFTRNIMTPVNETITKNHLSILFTDKTNIGENNRQEQRNEKKSVKKYTLHELRLFSDKTGLHGFKYVGDATITYFERIFWLLAISGAIGFAAYFIMLIYDKYNNSPVIISLSPQAVSIDTIPFPAVTICNLNQAVRKEAENILKYGSNWERILLDDYCNSNSTNIHDGNANEGSNSWEYVKSFIKRISQPCNEMFQYCMWKRDIIDCNKLFNTFFTDDGLCCTFNKLPEEFLMRERIDGDDSLYQNTIDWTPETGYVGKITEKARPWRAEGAGSNMGLTVVINAAVEDFYCSSTYSTGFKIMLSNPIETPKMAEFGFLIKPSTESRIVIIPSINDATDSLKNIDISKRQCFFPGERWLRYYRTYSQKNCRLECQTNYTLAECKCIPYFLPKQLNVTICGKSKENCVEKMKEKMNSIITADKESSTCNCLKSCFEVNYNKEITFGKLDVRSVPQHLLQNFTQEYFVNNMAVVRFFFEESIFKKFTKSELYGFSDFLSSTGGLLGLFLGFSFLSVVEVIYYLSIRICCTALRSKKQIIKRNEEEKMYPFYN